MEISKKEKSPKVWATSSALVSPSLTSIGVDGGKAPLFDTATMKKTSQLTFFPLDAYLTNVTIEFSRGGQLLI